jgi:hypothetical protein
MCGIKIHLIALEPDSKRVVQYSSSLDFTLKEAVAAVKTCDKNQFEKFTNADYERIEN